MRAEVDANSPATPSDVLTILKRGTQYFFRAEYFFLLQ